jgi:hypothetical protein
MDSLSTGRIVHPRRHWLLVCGLLLLVPAAGQDSASDEVRSNSEVQAPRVSLLAAMVPPSSDISPEAESPASAPTNAGQRAAAAKNLALAHELLSEAKYLTIPGPRGSALNAYRMALKSDPDNAEARKGMQQIVDRLVALVEQTLAAGNQNRAQTLLTSAEGVVEPFIDRSGVVSARAALEKSAAAVAKEKPAPKETASASARVSAANGAKPADMAVAAAPPPPAPAAAGPDKSELAEEASGPAPAVVELYLPPLYHVGRRLSLDAPGAVPSRWTINDRPIADATAALNYVFQEQDQGVCLLRVYTLGSDPVLVAEGMTEVRLFEDNPQEYVLGNTVRLDPMRHGPVENAYASYEWRLDGQMVSSEPVLALTFTELGTHRVECRMAGPTSDADHDWPAPWLAWNFEVVEPPAPVQAAAAPSGDPGAGHSAGQPGGNSWPLLAILGVAVIVLALSQAWMAYRLSVLARLVAPVVPEMEINQPVAPELLPPYQTEMEDLHEQVSSHETIHHSEPI